MYDNLKMDVELTKETELSSISSKLRSYLDEMESSLEQIGNRLDNIYPITKEEEKSSSPVPTNIPGFVGDFNNQLSRLGRLVKYTNTFRLHLNKLI